jgi:hypothetical protein
MIAYTAIRAAHRRLLEGKIAARPAAYRFRTFNGSVLLSEPAKAREMKLAGYNLGFTAQVMIALPLGEKPPEPEKELIDVQDLSGATHTYAIASVTPLDGTDCYTLALRARNAKPTRPAA